MGAWESLKGPKRGAWESLKGPRTWKRGLKG